jgi:hypothetical protein
VVSLTSSSGGYINGRNSANLDEIYSVSAETIINDGFSYSENA